MFKIRFTITYDGTNYFGWQRQSKQNSIQAVIEQTLSKILQKDIKIQGAGRTDRGVHAKFQVASCSIPLNTDLLQLKKSLNSLLPNDIRILDLEQTDKNFHPRYSSKGKIYTYRICTTPLLNPFYRHTWYHHPYPLDLTLIKKAIEVFLGEKDFTSFANNLGKNTIAPSPIKTIYSIKIQKDAYGFILIFHGNGFLYKMVRNLTGALLDIGEKKITINDLHTILEKKTNTHNLRQAPAHGLCLESILY